MAEVTFRDRLREFFYYPKLSEEEDRVADPRSFCGFLDDAPDDAPVSLYLHVPFCDYLCHFCPFYKTLNQATDRSTMEAFFHAMTTEIRWYADSPALRGRPVSWVEVGGGTPTSVAPAYLEQMMTAVRESFRLTDDCFISVEGEAITLQDRSKLALLRDLGVNRVSFGVQTFDEALRRRLGVRPEVGDLYRAAEAVRAAGIEEFAIDLLASLPNHSLDDMRCDVRDAHRLGPDYVDVYGLQLWENTWFKQTVEGSSRLGPQPDQRHDLAEFELVRDGMRELGMREVHSYTFATAGPHPYIDTVKEHIRANAHLVGLGPSARGYVKRRQYINVASIDEYVRRLGAGQLPYQVGMVCSELEQAHRLMTAFPTLLLNIDTSTVPRYDLFEPDVQRLVGSGYLSQAGPVLSLTDLGLSWAGNVSRMFFSREQQARMTRSLMYALRQRINPYNQDQTGVPARRERVG
jgi:oxygen-independent coproporphyrinogen III oxidase